MSRVIPWTIGVIVVATIGASILLLANALRMQRETSNEVQQHFETVLALRRTQALLVDAETGQRGYLLTADPSFLEPYQRARDQLPAELRKLAGTDPDQRLERLATTKLAELGRTVDLASQGRKDEAVTIVIGGSGKRYMDEFRAETARRVDDQQRQLNDALARSEQYTVRTYSALALLILAAAALLIIGVRLLLRTRRLEIEALRLRQVEEAQRRTSLIARELNHRVKNLFSIVIAIVELAGRGSTSAKDAVSRIRDRVEALARAHEVSLGVDPMSGFDLQDMLRTILAPYTSNAAELELNGPGICLPSMRVTPIGLIIHELATNAVKYGAWSASGGKVALRWSVGEAQQMNGTPALNMLRLEWDESRPTPIDADGASGFGSKLIAAAVAQLDGTLTRKRGDHGLSIIIDAPIVEDASERSAADDL